MVIQKHLDPFLKKNLILLHACAKLLIYYCKTFDNAGKPAIDSTKIGQPLPLLQPYIGWRRYLFVIEMRKLPSPRLIKFSVEI